MLRTLPNYFSNNAFFKTRFLLFLFCSFVSISFSHMQPANAKEKQPDLRWLKLSASALQNWEAVIDSSDQSRMNIILKKNISNEIGRKKILCLVPKKSKSYSLSTSELMKVLFVEKIPAEIVLVNFAKNMERGLAALDYAEKNDFDLIFSMGSGSSAFVHKHYNGGRIPVVTSTQKDPVALGQIADYEHGSNSNIAYTSLNVPLDIQMSYLLHLKPSLKNIALMYNRNHTQVMATEVNPAQKALKELNINVVNVAVESRKTSKATLAASIPAALKEMRLNDPELENSIFWITSSTAVFSQIKTINSFSENVPVLGSIPNIVTEGDDSAVLAIGIDRRNNAHLASVYAVKILKGIAKPGELKVGVVTPPDVAINFRVARKIGLKIPFRFFESAAFIYDYDGRPARSFGQKVTNK